jgi:hypothetical protein
LAAGRRSYPTELVADAGGWNGEDLTRPYGNVFDELDGGIRRPAEDVIRDARTRVMQETRAPLVHPQDPLDASNEDKSLPFAETS